MNDSIDIIRLPARRWADYRDLRLRALREQPDAFGEPLAHAEQHDDEHWQTRLRDTADGRSWLLFAESSERLVGMAGAFRPRADDPTMAMVVSVFVLPDFRGRGIATTLMEQLLRVLTEAAMERALLHVTASRHEAVQLYNRLGFVEVERASSAMGDGRVHDVLVMLRALR